MGIFGDSCALASTLLINHREKLGSGDGFSYHVSRCPELPADSYL
jgi:hypothetical protein